MASEAESAREMIAFLRGLRAVRQFRPEPIPAAVLDDVLAVARWTGSARNEQPWEFVVVRDREMLRALAGLEGTAPHLAGAAVGIVLVMAGNPRRVVHEIYDEGRLSERIMLAAAAHGVGACIGWFSDQGIADLKALLGIPAERLVRTALSLGYPDEAAPARPARANPGRKPFGEIVYWERYGQHAR
ncbi:MAG TPA: nitroreductase family protein [Chloroflexota bacterium]|nr:nitroreductase family protein [Chloroflexota bacterium]